MKKEKRMKYLILTSLSIAAGIGLVSCNKKNDNKNPDPEPSVTEYTVKFNVNDPDLTDSITLNDIDDLKVESGKTVNIDSYSLTYEGYTFDGWFSDNEFVNQFTSNTEITSDLNLYAKWTRIQEEPKISKVEYSVDFNDAIANKSANEIGEDGLTIKNVFLSKGVTLDGDGNTTIDGVSYKRIKNIKGDATLSSDKKTATLPTKQYIKVSIGGKGSVTLHYAPGGSNSRNLYVLDSDGNVLENVSNNSSSSYRTLTIEVESAKDLIICGSNGHNFYKIDTEYEVELGEQTGIEVSSKGTYEFLEGSEFDSSSIEVSAVYSSGATKIIDSTNYTVDSSAVDMTKDGTYTVAVTTKDGKYTTNYDINVYKTTDVELSLQYMVKDSNNRWGNNSALRNSDVEQIYFTATNDIKISDSLTFTANATLNGKTKTFIIPSSKLSISTNMTATSTSGTYNVTLSSTINGVVYSETYNIYLVTTAAAIEDNTITVTVDQNYTGLIGENIAGQGNTFTTIKQAIEFIEKCESVNDSMKKIINVKAGYYWEKVDVSVPNVSIIGEDAATTIIEYNAANGFADARNLGYGTDGSSTFGVRCTAVDFYAEGITFSNYEKSVEVRKATGAAQALAIMIQADRAVFNNCKFLGFQDTIEMQGAGRVYFYDCFIQGATDYIFGTNTSALFEKCEIYTITNDQADNGGFICAPKGINKGSDQAKYGYIFNDCDFTNDGKTTAGTTALYRPWDQYAYITVMNSRLGSHISKSGYSGKDKGDRTVNGLINNDKITAAISNKTLILQEYNNTGDGAIDSNVNSVTIISKDAADTLLASFWNAYTILTFEFSAWEKPTLITALDTPVITANNNVVSWETITGAASYEIYLDNSLVDTVTTTSYTVTVTGTDSKVIKIVAVPSDTTVNKNSKASNELTIAASSTPLNAPIVESNASNTISWNAVENATSYEVYIDDTLVDTVTTTSYTISTTEAKTVSVTVIAVPSDTDQAHEKSAASTALNVELILFTYVIDFNSTDTELDDTDTVKNYQIPSDAYYENNSGTIGDDFVINVDATSGKLAAATNGYTQFNAGTQLTFKTPYKCKITVVSYSANVVSINTQTSETTTIEYTADANVDITITTSANDWLTSITIEPIIE